MDRRVKHGDDAGEWVNMTGTRCRGFMVVDRTRKFAVEAGLPCAFSAFPEIVTRGKSEEEALAMPTDAMCLVLEAMTGRGQPIPPAFTPPVREVTV
jgi:predicted RNase H-like HicB family nuclease